MTTEELILARNNPEWCDTTYAPVDWQNEVDCGRTSLSYWPWVDSMHAKADLSDCKCRDDLERFRIRWLSHGGQFRKSILNAAEKDEPIAAMVESLEEISLAFSLAASRIQ